MWLRQLNPLEQYVCRENEKGCVLSCYDMTITSKKELTEELVMKAIRHLCRKFIMCRLYIAEKDGCLWYKIQEKLDIDFQMLPRQPPEEVTELLTTTPILQMMPLWKVRMMPVGRATQSGSGADLYKYHFFLAFSNVLSDGRSSFTICRLLQELLDDAVSGQPLNEEVPGEFVSYSAPHANSEFIREVRSELEGNREKVRRVISRTEGIFASKCVFPHFLPNEDEEKPTSKIINKELTEEETKSFIQTCKRNGVRVHTVLCTLINKTLIELIKEKNPSGKEYDYTVAHLVNNRRYYDKQDKDVIGVHSEYMYTVHTVIDNAIHDFGAKQTSLIRK